LRASLHHLELERLREVGRPKPGCITASIPLVPAIHRILTHLGHPTGVPIARPAREPPVPLDIPAFEGDA
jgi:hypothetical protein